MELIELLHVLARTEVGKVDSECRWLSSGRKRSFSLSQETDVLYRAIYALEFDVPLGETVLQQLNKLYLRLLGDNRYGDSLQESTVLLGKAVKLLFEREKI